jgi:hypothetical protein
MTIHQLHPNGRPATWQGLLATCATEAEVVAVARDFLATISPCEAARLPETLRPRRMLDANDITTYAFDLVRGDAGDDGGTQRALHRLAHFFSRASIRLAEIMSGASSPRASDEGRSA